MNVRCLCVSTLAVMVLWCGRATADPPGAAELAKKIDDCLASGWTASGIEPAPRADDAEFMRRVYLDLAGRIPSVSEARAFLGDKRPDRRQRLVETLLASPRYVAHFANFYRTLLIPE